MWRKSMIPMNQAVCHEKVNFQTKTKSSYNTDCQKPKKMQISKVQLKTHLIKKFKKNNSEKISKQRRFARILENSDQFISDEKNFTCPICLEVLISPVIFECGHFGCLKCIETVSVYQNKCFLCRKVFENLEYKPSTVIATIINKNILKNIENPIEHYTRLADHLEWQRKKQLSLKEVEIGSLVDVRCVECGKWKCGVVLSVKNTGNSDYILLIRYKHEKENIEELIEISSSRLAKQGFYTEKRVIETTCDYSEETEGQIPQISIQSFENILMDRNLFSSERKEENIFSQSFGTGNDFLLEQKAFCPESPRPREDMDSFEIALEQFLNPQYNYDFLEPELLEVNF